MRLCNKIPQQDYHQLSLSLYNKLKVQIFALLLCHGCVMSCFVRELCLPRWYTSVARPGRNSARQASPGPHSSLTKVASGQCAIKATLNRGSKVGVVFRFRDSLRRNKRKHNNRNIAQHFDLLSERFCNYRYPSVVRRDLGQKPLLAAAGRCVGCVPNGTIACPRNACQRQAAS